MNNKFDELAKGMAQSVTRRAALKKFGLGLAGMALACFGLANTAEAAKHPCDPNSGVCCCYGCTTQLHKSNPLYQQCAFACGSGCI